MLQKEFEDRTEVNVSFDEYTAIDKVYMESDLDKDEFCKMWCKMNANRIKAAKKKLAEKARKEKETERLHTILSKLNAKSQKFHYNLVDEPPHCKLPQRKRGQFSAESRNKDEYLHQ